MIYRSIYFWILTVLLLAVVGFTGVKIIPPLLSAIQENRLKATELETELAEQKKFLLAVNTIKDDQAELDAIHDKATLALPRQADTAILLLQLDGLLGSLGLSSARLDVPLETASAESAGTTEGAAPASGKTLATISGEFGYESFVALLDGLKTFARWNRVSSFDLTRSGDVFNATVITEVFAKPGPVGEFSGNTTILEKAQVLFGNLASYATEPNIETEGTFGKANPFAP